MGQKQTEREAGRGKFWTVSLPPPSRSPPTPPSIPRAIPTSVSAPVLRARYPFHALGVYLCTDKNVHVTPSQMPLK